MRSGKARLIHREETLYRTRPSWSPDGKRFIYASHLGSEFTNLFVLPTAGGEPYKMTFGEHDSFCRAGRLTATGSRLSNELGLPQLKLLKAWGRRTTRRADSGKKVVAPVRSCERRDSRRGPRANQQRRACIKPRSMESHTHRSSHASVSANSGGGCFMPTDEEVAELTRRIADDRGRQRVRIFSSQGHCASRRTDGGCSRAAETHGQPESERMVFGQ